MLRIARGVLSLKAMADANPMKAALVFAAACVLCFLAGVSRHAHAEAPYLAEFTWNR